MVRGHERRVYGDVPRQHAVAEIKNSGAVFDLSKYFGGWTVATVRPCLSLSAPLSANEEDGCVFSTSVALLLWPVFADCFQ